MQEISESLTVEALRDRADQAAREAWRDATGLDARPVVSALDALRLEIRAATVRSGGERERFEGWARVELMGHRERTALVREVEVGGRTFLELSCLPDPHVCSVCETRHRGLDRLAPNDGQPHEFVEPNELYVEVYSPSAVFCLTPLAGEAEARRVAAGGGDVGF